MYPTYVSTKNNSPYIAMASDIEGLENCPKCRAAYLKTRRIALSSGRHYYISRLLASASMGMRLNHALMQLSFGSVHKEVPACTNWLLLNRIFTTLNFGEGGVMSNFETELLEALKGLIAHAENNIYQVARPESSWERLEYARAVIAKASHAANNNQI
jgi:hypothetical protein